MVRNSFGAFAVVVAGIMLYLTARYAAIGTETMVAYLITNALNVTGA